MGKILNKEGKLEVRAEITTNWERQVHQNQTWTDKDLFQGILTELQNLREEVKDVKSQLGDTKRIKTESGGPDCSKCYTSLKPPSVIYQCVGGHLVCKHCFDTLTHDQCLVCNGRFSGRATGLENYLENYQF